MFRSRQAIPVPALLLVAVLGVAPALAKERTVTLDLGDPKDGGISLSLSGSWLTQELLSDLAEEIECDDRPDREMREALLLLRRRGEGASVIVREGDESTRLSRRRGRLEIRTTEPGEEPARVVMPWAMGECMLGNAKPMRKLARDGFELKIEKEGRVRIEID